MKEKDQKNFNLVTGSVLTYGLALGDERLILNETRHPFTRVRMPCAAPDDEGIYERKGKYTVYNIRPPS